MPNKPETAYLDLDMALFKAASSAEKVQYVYSTPLGEVVSSFDSAEGGKSWVAECETFGMDLSYGYEGDINELVRTVEYIDLGEHVAIEAFDTILKEDLKACSTPKWKGFVSGATGAKNFRHKLATLREYKKGREGAHKPVYLEATRKHALSYKEVSSPPSWIEADDICQAYAQRDGEKGLLYSGDKDSLTAVGCWVLNYSYYDEMIYSDPSTVGWLEQRDKGKVLGVGWLFLMYQLLNGDTTDGIGGCKGWGDKKIYPLLSPYNNKPLEALPELLATVAKEYKIVYGDSYTYKHWETGEDLTVSWYEVLHENLKLLYMLKGTKDSASKSVLKYLNRENV